MRRNTDFDNEKHKHMNHTIFFADKILNISAAAPADDTGFVCRLAEGGRITRAEVLRLLSEYGRVTVTTPQEDEVFAALSAEFVAVEAAGGVVRDAEGRALMIYRNGRWDLPKGHLEPGETVAECALREVAEETGVAAGLESGEELCSTLHCYNLYGKWEMKRTHWYAMRYVGGTATPQTEEGIARAAWLSGVELKSAVLQSYPTIRQVFCRLKSVCNQ